MKKFRVFRAIRFSSGLFAQHAWPAYATTRCLDLQVQPGRYLVLKRAFP